jgi:hypothetical protein
VWCPALAGLGAVAVCDEPDFSTSDGNGVAGMAAGLNVCEAVSTAPAYFCFLHARRFVSEGNSHAQRGNRQCLNMMWFASDGCCKWQLL